MANQDNRPKDAGDLRQKAEALARKRAGRAAEDSPVLSADEIRETLYELRVHQIELEMQNEQLRVAQVEIEAGRARYFDLYDLAPVGYCTLSAQGLILEANLTIATLLEVARGALVKNPISRYILKEDQDTYYLHRKRLLETGEPQESELRLVKPNGKIFWVHLITAAQNTDGECDYRAVITDISDRKYAEEEKEKLQIQLAQAQKLESVGRLAGGVAHDFNNTLCVIIGNAELALSSLDMSEPFYLEFIEIKNAAQRSADLTRQLLAFARKQTVTPQVLDLNNTIESMLKMLQRLIGEDIELLWEPAKSIEPIRMDPVQVDQVVTILIINARDAIGRNAGKVTIETALTELEEDYCAHRAGLVPGCYVMMTITDNGCGMDKQTEVNIFEPFFTSKAQGEGTGLGLATIYGIVKQNQGFIDVYSEPGQGTTFRIYLPVYEVRKSEPAKKIGAEHPFKSGHGTILLVEDEPAILAMGKKMLERLGYAVLAASTPGEAIRLAEEHNGAIDLLMTDVVMPEMNGRDLAERIFAVYPEIKRLFTSGYTANVIAHHGVLDEGVNFIQKPFSMQGLSEKVREALDKD